MYILLDEINYRKEDDEILPRMLEIGVENIKRKIELEASNISGEMLTYSEKEIFEILIKKLG